MQKLGSNQDAVEVLHQFLEQVRQEKTAETVSFKDKAEATPTNQSKPESSEGQVKQTNLGKEQTQAADDSGSNVNAVSANSDDKDKKPVDDQGPKKLDTDEPVAEDGNIGPMRKQEITQEQKMARQSRLGNAILQKIAEELGAMGETEEKPKKKEGESEDDDDDEEKEGSEQKQAADAFLDDCLQKSAAYAQAAHDSYLYGLLKRKQDEDELAGADFSKIGIDQQMLAKLGGVSGLLLKVAEEDPAAVMPEGMEMALPPDAGAALPMEGAEAGAPAESAGMSEADLSSLADALAEAGVEPEAIDEAAQAVQQLIEANVAPEEAAAAIQQVVDESMSAGGEEAGEPVAEEAAETPAEEAAEEGKEAVDKEARARIKAVVEFLHNQLR